MDAVLTFVIEAVCMLAVVLLAAVAAPVITGKPLDRSVRLRSAAILIVCLVWLAATGSANLLPIVVGFTVFCFVVIGVALTLVLVWRFTHRGDGQVIERSAAADFSNMGVSGLLAAGCLLAAAVSTVWLAQAVADAWAYSHAPPCTIATSSSCRSQAAGTVVGRSSSRTSDRVRVRVGGQDRTIDIATGHDVWQSLISGEQVDVTSWKGHVTAVTAPGKGTMETSDTPGFGVIVGVVFVVVSLLGFALMAAYGLIYRSLWRAARTGADVDRFAA